MKFAKHGLFEVKTEGELLIVDAMGPFNEELIIQYERALELCIKDLEVSKWNQIILLHQLSIFTPEAEKALIQSLINRRVRGLIACTVVLINIEGEFLIKAQMSRCYEQAGVKYKFMTSIDEAKEWLTTV
jgi:hypothetical protein